MAKCKKCKRKFNAVLASIFIEAIYGGVMKVGSESDICIDCASEIAKSAKATSEADT